MLQEDVIVGQNTVIGENSILYNVSLGSNCTLVSNVSLRDCIIHDDVRIGANCQFKGCIIGQGAIIGTNVIIHDKSVIGPGVCIKDNCEPIGPLTWVVSTKPSDGFDSESDDLEVGELGPRAFFYTQTEDGEESDSDEDAQNNSPTAEGLEETWGRLALSEDETYNDNDSSSSSDDDSDDFGLEEAQGIPDIINDFDASFDQFHVEVMESLQRGFDDGSDASNLVLEINASRHAYAVTATQVIHSVVMSVLRIASSAAANKGDLNPNGTLKEIKEKLTFFKSLILKYVKTESAQVDCIKGIEMQCAKEMDNFLPIIAKIVHFMYDTDVLSDDAILDWYHNAGSDEEDDDELPNANAGDMVRQKMKPLIKWLEEESDEDD